MTGLRENVSPSSAQNRKLKKAIRVGTIEVYAFIEQSTASVLANKNTELTIPPSLYVAIILHKYGGFFKITSNSQLVFTTLMLILTCA